MLFVANIAISIIILIALTTGSYSPNLRISIYGIQSFGLMKPLSLILLMLLFAHSASSVIILLGKSYALKFAKLNLSFGLVLCSVSIFLRLFYKDVTFYFPFEAIAIVLMLFSLKKIEFRWSMAR